MDTDLAFVLGAVILALGFPAIISAFTDGRPPRVAALCFVVGGAFLAYALTRSPSGYDFADVPAVFGRVIGTFLR